MRWQNPESAADYVAAPAAMSARPRRAAIGISFFWDCVCAKEWKATRSPTGVEKFVRDGLLERAGARVRLTPRGVLLSNEVFAEFIQPAG